MAICASNRTVPEVEPVVVEALTVRAKVAEAVASVEVAVVVVVVILVTAEVAVGEEVETTALVVPEVVASPADNRVRIAVGLRCPTRVQIDSVVPAPGG